MSRKSVESIEDARDALLKGELDRAERLATKILSATESPISVLCVLGVVALRRERFPEALSWFERAIEAGADDALVYGNLGETYRRLGRSSDALRCLESSLQRDNADVAPHFNLARLHRANGEPRLAEHFFRNVLLLDPKMARAHFELAELYREEGHPKDAATEYQAALDILGVSSDYDNGEKTALESYWKGRLGALFRETGETFWAIEVLRNAIAADSKNAEGHLEMARCMFEMGWEQDAQTHWESFRQLNRTIETRPKEYVATRVEGPKEWCARRGEQYVSLARAQALSLPQFHTLPSDAKEGLTLGRPFIPELYLASMKSCRVLPSQLAIVSEDSRLLLDGVVNTPQSFLLRGEGVIHATDDLRVMLELPVPRVALGGLCAVLGGGGDHYSWMFETLARFWALEQHPDYKNVSLAIREDLTEPRRAMLDAIGVDCSKLRSYPLGCQLHVSQLVVPSLMSIGHWISPIGLQYLRRKLASGHRGRFRRVFLSRSAAPHSRLSNQSDLMPMLSRHGFELVDAVETPPMQLISILSDASAVIGFDDDSLANMVVAPQGANVGVIILQGEHKLRSYFVCAQLGHSMTYLLARADYSTNALQSKCDYSVDPKLVAQFLDSLPAGGR